MNTISHPSYYNNGRKECIVEMQENFGTLALISFCVLNAHKYYYRKGKKEGNSVGQDIQKAQWYINYARNLYLNLPLWKRLVINTLGKPLIKYLMFDYGL